MVAAGFGDAISKCQPRKIVKELGMLGITSLAAASVVLSPLSASAVSGGKGEKERKKAVFLIAIRFLWWMHLVLIVRMCGIGQEGPLTGL